MKSIDVKSFVEIKGFYNEVYVVAETEKAIKVESENGRLFSWIAKSTILNLKDIEINTGDAYQIEKCYSDAELLKIFGGTELKDVFKNGKKYIAHKEADGKWYVGKGKNKWEVVEGE